MDLPNTSQEKEKKRPVRNRVNDFIYGLTAAGSGIAVAANEKHIGKLYQDYIYPNYKNPNIIANAVASDPNAVTGQQQVLYTTLSGKKIGQYQINSPQIQNQLQAAEKLYPGVKAAEINVAISPHSYASQARTPEKSTKSDILLTSRANQFTLAHELGHVVSHREAKPSLAKKIHKLKRKIAQSEDLTKNIVNLRTAGAAIAGVTSNSLLGAAAKGALVGAAGMAPVIGSEIAATHRGLKIMKEAGIKPTYGTGIAQVGNYLTGSVLMPTAISVTSYGIKKATNALLHKSKEKQQKEEQLKEVAY